MPAGVIGYDLDDVLAPTSANKVRWYYRKYGTGPRFFRPEDWDDPQLPGLWGEQRAEKERLFYEEGDPYGEDTHPIPGARTAVQALSRRYRGVVVTSGYKEHRDPKTHWVETQLPQIEDVIFVGGPADEFKTKADACRALDISLMIDDIYASVAACREAGIPGIAFGPYQWSIGPAIKGLYRGRNWGRALKLAPHIIDPRRE